MQYYDDMQHKYGFSDGEAVPPDARECREVYIRFLNALAERLGSKVRAIAYDRGGVHNPYLILLRYEGKETADDADAEQDDAWQRAVEIAEEADLDNNCVRVQVTIAEDDLKAVIDEAFVRIANEGDQV